VPWVPPHALRRNICSPQESQTIANCFFGQQDCQTKVTAECHQCAISATNAPQSSAIIVDPATMAPALNVEGCVAGLQGDITPNGCGAKLAQMYSCEETSCGTCQNDDDWGVCADAADQATCATSVSAASCATPYLDTCIAGATDIDVAANLIRIFCGP
jgi:hypothetical protein